MSYNKCNLSIITPNTDKYIFFSLASAASQYHPEDVISLANSSDSKYFWAGSEDGGIFRMKSSGDLSILETDTEGVPLPLYSPTASITYGQVSIT